jgi:hypothetical protein
LREPARTGKHCMLPHIHVSTAATGATMVHQGATLAGPVPGPASGRSPWEALPGWCWVTDVDSNAKQQADMELTAADQLSLGLSRTYYALARALRLNKLRDLLSSAAITLDAAVWLLGRCYSCHSAGAEAQEEVSRGRDRTHNGTDQPAGPSVPPRFQHRRRPPPSSMPGLVPLFCNSLHAECNYHANPPPLHAFVGVVQEVARMLHHFQSILWMTYRTAFTPITVGDVHLRSDAGWGCTLRRYPHQGLCCPSICAVQLVWRLGII